MNKDKFDEARMIFTNIIEDESNFEVAYLYRGLCYMQLKKYKSALGDFNHLIEQHPMMSIKAKPKSTKQFGQKYPTRVEYIDAYFQRGVTQYFMDSLEASKQDFEFVLTQSNRPVLCRNYLANIYYLQGDLQNACLQIKIAESLKPGATEMRKILELKILYCQ